MGTGTLTWPVSAKPPSFWVAVTDWLRVAAGFDRPPPVQAAQASAPPRPLPGTRRRAAVTQPFREVATRSLGRSVFEPQPLFIPEGADELASWLALPRDRQALLAAIAARLDADSQRHLRVLLARGVLGEQDLAGEGDLLAHLAALYTSTPGFGCDQNALLEATIRSIARPELLRAAAWIVCLARQNPAELGRLVKGLAGTAGCTRLIGGRTLVRSQGWAGSSGDVLGRLLGSAKAD